MISDENYTGVSQVKASRSAPDIVLLDLVGGSVAAHDKAGLHWGSALNRIGLYLELTKPRILSMVLVTTTLGFFLGARGIHPVSIFLLTLLGVGAPRAARPC